MASMIAELLKTPQQVRQERQDVMRQNSLAQAALLSRGSQGSTALPGLLRGFAAQQLVEQGPQMENIVQRGLGAAGMLGGAVGALTPEQAQATQMLGVPEDERQAAVLSGLARETGTKDPKRLREIAEQLRNNGRADVADQLETRATQLEQAATQTRMRQAMAQEFENLGRSDLAALATNPDTDMLELVKELRMSKEKAEGEGKMDIPTAQEQELYTRLTSTNENAEAKLNAMVDFGWWDSAEEKAQFATLKDRAIAIAHQRSKGNIEKFEQEYNTLVNQYYNQYTQQQEAKAAAEKAKTTPINVPGLQEIDRAAGFEDQTNPFAIGAQ